MKIPWWLNPWREVGRLRHRLDEQHGNIVAAREQIASLQGQLAAAVTGAKTSGAALATSVPEFILAGIPRGQGKRIQVSRDIEVTAFAMTEMGEGEPRFKIGAIMGHLLVIDKPTYGECLQHLATIWDQPVLIHPGHVTLGPDTHYSPPEDTDVPRTLAVGMVVDRAIATRWNERHYGSPAPEENACTPG